jgi:hypothetical protein
MGDGPSGGDSDQVNTTTNTNKKSTGTGKTVAMDSYEVEAMAEEEASKGYSSGFYGNEGTDSSGNRVFSETYKSGNWNNAPTKTRTYTGTDTGFTNTIMGSANPQEALYDYSNKVRSGTAGKVTNAELNALEAQGLDTFGMGLRGTEGFGGKMGHDDYGTPMSRQSYNPGFLNQGGDPTDEAQRVNNPMMSGLVGLMAGMTPIGTIAKGAQMFGLADPIGSPPTNMMGKISGALTMGLTNPANPDLYDAGNYTQAVDRAAATSQMGVEFDRSKGSMFSPGGQDKDNEAGTVGQNLNSGGSGGGTSSSGGGSGSTPNYDAAATVTGFDMNGGGAGNAMVNYLSNMGRNRSTGNVTVDADKQNFGAFRRMNFDNFNVGDQQNFDLSDWRKSRRFGAGFFNMFK